jgi:hypothetical protein
VRVVDQALPSGYGPRLLEVDPHDDQQPVGVPLGLGDQPAGVLQSGLRIMHRARSDDDQQAVVLAVDHGLDLAPAAGDQALGLGAERQPGAEFGRGGEGFKSTDPQIVGLDHDSPFVADGPVSLRCQPVEE